MAQQQIEARKKELEQCLVENPLNSLIQQLDLELKQNFFLGDNVDHEQNDPKIILKKTIKKCKSEINYSPAKVRSRNFLTNISYNCFNSIDFDNASFIISCFTCILFNLNPFFLSENLTMKATESMLRCCGTILFHIYILRNDNFIVLNKLSLKYQNALDIVNNFILEENSNFV